jgi:hypothetical protein
MKLLPDTFIVQPLLFVIPHQQNNIRFQLKCILSSFFQSIK